MKTAEQTVFCIGLSSRRYDIRLRLE